ncbi:enoyl-CoA hydratase/isomerase family protein [Pseudomonas sp. 148P]|uniref:Enoyl-CoA hydratase/isomerase family protein n=1 Tax=Pseudomonas ulcerans TaxID=3115852 RepID=A0ABU7HZM6_9PSED|nr:MULTISPECIES: enoyl-CoA hydratase/isomerase family protein [unclassified Pseudomonas]MEE1925566.1 enoyl-CoA hydratase/isomerase family protein [Pseudomonas sp. 147P]MEE1937002.1 enoyl-CoA hydratase/isomerase family protein [Pseudomonas sp. 148P]
MTEDSVVLNDTADGVRTITLNRADKLNALNFALTEGLVAAFKAADADDSVRAVVVTGAGRGFCAGADTREFAVLTPDNQDLVERRAALTTELQGLVKQMGKPVIAAVNGYAMGGGAGLAISCDLVLAGESARFGYPEVKHGIVAAIVMAGLVEHVGRKAAFELVATGRTVHADEARALGLVNRVLPDSQLLDEARALALSLAAHPVNAMQATKRIFHQVAELPFSEGLKLGQQLNARMRAFRQQEQQP